MKEMDRMTLTEENDFVNGFQDNNEDEVDEEGVIIQLIVQGKPITVNEHILTKYSKYFWNLFQSLPPLPMKSLKPTTKGKFSIGNNNYIISYQRWINEIICFLIFKLFLSSILVTLLQ